VRVCVLTVARLRLKVKDKRGRCDLDPWSRTVFLVFYGFESSSIFVRRLHICEVSASCKDGSAAIRQVAVRYAPAQSRNYGTLLLRSSSALAFRTPTCTKRARSITLAGSHPAQTQKRYRSTQRWKVTALVTTSLAAMSHTQKNRVFSALSRLRESSLLHS